MVYHSSPFSYHYISAYQTHFFITILVCLFFQAGYKTLGVAVKFNDEPFRFVGILPMLDPPRHDTAHTIKNLVAAGIVVKVAIYIKISILLWALENNVSRLLKVVYYFLFFY